MKWKSLKKKSFIPKGLELGTTLSEPNRSIHISHVQPNVRPHLASVFMFSGVFLFFFIPVEGLCCRPKYWANIIHRFDDQNSLTSKCIENWALFERLTHSQRSPLSVIMPPGPPEVCPTQSPRKPALFCPIQGCVYKHLSVPGLTLEKISVSRGGAQPFGEFTPAERPGNSL